MGNSPTPPFRSSGDNESDRGSWSMAMTWYDLLFLHWPVPASALRPLVPEDLQLDTCDGSAWLALVPFGMSGVRPRGVPGLPWVSKFLELNVRTYVTHDGRPGVWFFSLDAANPLAVRVARRFYHLPYFDARMKLTTDADGWIAYRSTRTHKHAPSGEFAARYRPAGAVFASQPGSLEYWLTERYCLYAADAAGRLYRGDIRHVPWPLQPGEVQLHATTLSDWMGLPLTAPPALVHFSRQLDVVAWRLQACSAISSQR